MSFGFGVGDFLAVGRVVIDTVKTFKGSKASYEHLRRLEEQLSQLDRTLVSAREETNLMDLSSSGINSKVKHLVADMGLALGSCEEAIIRFRRAMVEYKDTCHTMGYAPAVRRTNRMEKMKGTISGIKKRFNITGDLEAALLALEKDLGISLRTYELSRELVQRRISEHRAEKQQEKLTLVSEQLSVITGHFERLSTVAPVQTYPNRIVKRETSEMRRVGIDQLQQLISMLLAQSENPEVLLQYIEDARNGKLQDQQPCPPAYSYSDNTEHLQATRMKEDLGTTKSRQLHPTDDEDNATTVASESGATASSNHSVDESGEGLLMVRGRALAAQKFQRLEPMLEALLLKGITMLMLMIQAFRYFYGAIPTQIGYVWNSETGRFTNIQILDPLGNTFDVHPYFCDSLSKLHELLKVYFIDKRGRDKVENREYCITNEDGSVKIETELDFLKASRPGSKLSMFMEVKQLAPPKIAGALGEDIQICPQCGAANYKTNLTSGNTFLSCISCNSDVRIFEDESGSSSTSLQGSRSHETFKMPGPRRPERARITLDQQTYYKKVFVTKFRDLTNIIPGARPPEESATGSRVFGSIHNDGSSSGSLSEFTEPANSEPESDWPWRLPLVPELPEYNAILSSSYSLRYVYASPAEPGPWKLQVPLQQFGSLGDLEAEAARDLDSEEVKTYHHMKYTGPNSPTPSFTDDDGETMKSAETKLQSGTVPSI